MPKSKTTTTPTAAPVVPITAKTDAVKRARARSKRVDGLVADALKATAGKPAPTTMARTSTPRVSTAQPMTSGKLEVAADDETKAVKTAAKKASSAPKRDSSIKTWTQTGIDVRAAVADIKAKLGDSAKGISKFEIVTTSPAVYATTLDEAKAAPVGQATGRYSVEKGTNIPEVRGHGYVVTLEAIRKGATFATWTVWLSADGPVVLTVDGIAR